jgi:hypothetical protein
MPGPGIELAAEDGYMVVDPIAERELAPHDEIMELFGDAAYELSSWRLVWDFRRMGTSMYNDVLDAFASAGYAEYVLALPDRVEALEEAFEKYWKPPIPAILPAHPKPLSTRRLDLTPFSDSWYDLREAPTIDAEIIAQEFLPADAIEDELRRDGDRAVQLGIAVDEREAINVVSEMLSDDSFQDGYARLVAGIADERREILSTFLDKIASNSLFSHIALVSEGDSIRVVPYHGHGIHNIDTDRGLLTVRPSRVGASTQWARFARAIVEFEELVNMPGVREAEIERLLREHPLFLRGLNYGQVYHQVILPLGDGTSLRPDVIAEPAGGGWAEILDLKLPSERIYVGGGDRPRLSAAIADAASQLRAYARYFEDRTVAERIEREYGFRCYKPRQAVIIGRDPRDLDERQREAAMTAYPDLRIVTYDELLRSAQARLLF